MSGKPAESMIGAPAVAAIEARHVRNATWDSGNPEANDGWVTWCGGCGQRPWPCDTAAVLAEAQRLRTVLAALRETIDWISTNDDAMGHGYCASQSGEIDPCTCGYEAKMEGWRAALTEGVTAHEEAPRG